VLPGQKAPPPANAHPPSGAPSPGRPATPVGQSPQKAQANQGNLNLPADLPGKVVQQLPANAIPPVTLMSKPTQFPKPGPQFNSGGSQAPAAPATMEGRRRSGMLKPGKTRTLIGSPPSRARSPSRQPGAPTGQPARSPAR
jgi:hypothetical protein